MKRVIKKIHQIWDKDNFPKNFINHQLSLKNKHSDWQYTLWDLDKCRNLIKKEYVYFLDTFDNFKFNIQKIDAARFFILDFEGGVYADLDIFFYKNLEDLIVDKKAVIFNRKEDHYLQKLFYDENKDDVINVLNTNGQYFLYNFYKINKYDSTLLSSKFFEFYKNTQNYKNEDFIYGIHEYANTWFEKTKVLV